MRLIAKVASVEFGEVRPVFVGGTSLPKAFHEDHHRRRGPPRHACRRADPQARPRAGKRLCLILQSPVGVLSYQLESIFRGSFLMAWKRQILRAPASMARVRRVHSSTAVVMASEVPRSTRLP